MDVINFGENVSEAGQPLAITVFDILPDEPNIKISLFKVEPEQFKGNNVIIVGHDSELEHDCPVFEALLNNVSDDIMIALESGTIGIVDTKSGVSVKFVDPGTASLDFGGESREFQSKRESRDL